MAPTAGLAPAKTDLKDLSRDDFAFVGVEKVAELLPMPRDGGLLSYRDMIWCPWQELHLHCAGFETTVSAVGLQGLEISGTPGRTFALNLRVRSTVLYTLSYGSFDERMVPMAGLAPALDRF